MKAYLINMYLLAPRSRSSAKVKVKYKGYVSQKNGGFGGIRVSQTHLVHLSNGALILPIVTWACLVAMQSRKDELVSYLLNH